MRVICNIFCKVKDINLREKAKYLFCIVFMLAIFVSIVCVFENNSSLVATMAIYDKNGNQKFNKNEYEYILGGQIVGIKILSEGVLVLNTDNVYGIEAGDNILRIDGINIQSSEEITSYVNSEEVIAKGSVNVTVKRGSDTFEKKLDVKFSNSTNKYEIGLWVKDSSAGIGTVTFYEKNNGYFAALGHGITETRENVIVPITSGAIVKAKTTGIKKGVAKEPGDIKGVIYKDVIGQIYCNTENGIYGILEENIYANYTKSECIEIADKKDVKEGVAYIYCAIENGNIECFEINICSVLLNSTGNKNIIIQVTDKVLLEKTGGIVQGMSGSPIVQNGKLIGAVTHVFLNDPTKGYAVFIQNMINDLPF